MQLEAVFEPRGALGYLYWYSLYPVHWLVFGGLLSGMARAMGRGGSPVALRDASLDELHQEPWLAFER